MASVALPCEATESFIRRLPKAELHLHIEGTLEPEMMLALADRNRVAHPFDSVDEARRAYEFTDLHSFLDIYYLCTGVLLEERDFYELTRAYLERAIAQNIRHVEIFFDPQAHTRRGVPFEAIIHGVHQALTDAERELPVTTRLILCFLRDLSAEEAANTLSTALPYKDWIAAVGLDSNEIGNPPAKFREVFDEARAHGFSTVAHAGEEGPPSYIVEALDLLAVSRIDHGVRCSEDPKLMARLAGSRIPLTVCPLSNVKLGIFESVADHNIGKLLEAGLCVTVNSDDPAYFGGYLCENYLALAQDVKLDRAKLSQLARNSFEAAFLGDDERRALVRELDRTLEAC